MRSAREKGPYETSDMKVTTPRLPSLDYYDKRTIENGAIGSAAERVRRALSRRVRRCKTKEMVYMW